MKKAWTIVTDWFEHGDLVPLLIIVSAWHYMSILQGKDPAVVALAIGLLVDLGHYRTIRAAFRYNGASWGERIARWMFALVMTVISLAYHQRYYNDWLFSAPIPLLIAGLAWLQRVDKPHRTEPIERAFVCPKCQARYKTQQALAGHAKAHKEDIHVKQ